MKLRLTVVPDLSFPFGKVLDIQDGAFMLYRDLVRSSVVLTVYVAGKSVAATSLARPTAPYSPQVLARELEALRDALLLQSQNAEMHAVLGALATHNAGEGQIRNLISQMGGSHDV